MELHRKIAGRKSPRPKSPMNFYNLLEPPNKFIDDIKIRPKSEPKAYMKLKAADFLSMINSESKT